MTSFRYRTVCHSLMLSAVAILNGCSDDSKSLEQSLTNNASAMQVNYSVLSNTTPLPCDKSVAEGNCYSAQLKLRFTDSLPEHGWQIVFSHLSPIQWEGSNAFDIEHINGDLHRLVPTRPINPEQDYTIDLLAGFWSVSKSDVIPNYFFVYGEDNTQLIQSTVEYQEQHTGIGRSPHAGEMTRTEQIKRNSDDQSQVHTAQQLFRNNEVIHQSVDDQASGLNIVPSIQTIKPLNGQLDVSQGLFLVETVLKDFPVVQSYFAQSNVKLSNQGVPVVVEHKDNENKVTGQYTLKVLSDKIVLTSHNQEGTFYGLLSLSKLLYKTTVLPLGEYIDRPRFSFRGLHLDVARNFRSKPFVLSLIDQMAQLKLNKLHLHLADDEGWRLQIKGLDELTEIGAFRCYDLSETRCLLPQLGSGPNRETSVNGYYSATDYIEIVKYAAQRQVEIIPSLDMPGHSRAAVKSMAARSQKFKQLEDNVKASEFVLTDPNDTTQYSSVQHYNDNTLNPCLDSTYHFIDKVLDEVVALHQSAGVPLTRYHIGADETAGAWDDSPACQKLISATSALQSAEQLTAYFITRVADMVTAKGVIPGGWSDGLAKVEQTHLLNLQVNVWDPLVWQGHQHATKFANKGWQTVLSLPDVLYFDFPYAVSPDEPGYYWATRAIDSYKVFQFMPDNLAKHDTLWRDRMNKPFTSEKDPGLNSGVSYSGIQAQLWSEIVRLDSTAEYMIYPRIFSFAEKAWSKPSWESNYNGTGSSENQSAVNQSWQRFSKRLVEQELPLLAQQAVNFRIAPPGAERIEGMLHMNHLFADMILEFRPHNGQWQVYKEPTSLEGTGHIRARLPNTNRYSQTLEIR